MSSSRGFAQSAAAAEPTVQADTAEVSPASSATEERQQDQVQSPAASSVAAAEAAPASPAAAAADSRVLEYHGPLSDTVRRLKKLSLFSCAASMAAAPIIVGLDPATSLGAKLSIAGMLSGFGIFTTGLLHWFTSPYVHKLHYERDSGKLTSMRLNILARPVVMRFRAEDAEYADTFRPQSTFQVRGQVHYLDPDHFPDTALFKRLAVPDPNAPPEEGPAADTGGPQRAEA